jgi:hypothetical protein
METRVGEQIVHVDEVMDASRSLCRLRRGARVGVGVGVVDLGGEFVLATRGMIAALLS